VISWRSEKKFVSQQDWFGATGDARFDIVSFDPLGQPAKIAVTVEWIGAKSPETFKYNH
jgi:hypothetical protein